MIPQTTQPTCRRWYPLVIQDRMFDTNGQLFFPADSAGGVLAGATNPEHPYWTPEFIGDIIVVNGKVWPFRSSNPSATFPVPEWLQCPRLMRCSWWTPCRKTLARLWVIGTDGGYLDTGQDRSAGCRQQQSW